MRRLVAHQAVTVDLDGAADFDDGCIDCRVRSVFGPVATLDTVDKIAPTLQKGLTPGSLSFMTFKHGSAPVALRGVTLAVPNSDAIEFVVIDGIQVAERRNAERVALLTHVRVASLGADGAVTAAISTISADLSMGGALLTCQSGLGDGPRWQLELALPGDPQPLWCEAQLVRQTPTHIAVKFANMRATDQLRLATALADHQRCGPPGA